MLTTPSKTEKRTRLAAKIRAAHPDRVPVIVEKHARSKLIPDISKRKYVRHLLPHSLDGTTPFAGQKMLTNFVAGSWLLAILPSHS